VRALAAFSIRNSVLVHLMIAGLLLVGAWSLIQLPRELMSEISFNWVFVRVDWPNAAPQEIEQQIALPVEEALDKVEGVSSVSIRCKEGYAFFSVKFEQVSDQEFARRYTELKDEVGAVTFPEEALDPFFLNFSSQDFVPMVSVVIHGQLPPAELFDLAEQVEDDVAAIDGIGKIEVGGVRDRQILVSVDPDALAGHGLSMAQIAGALQASNTNIPGGVLAVGPAEYLIRTVNQFSSIDDIGGVVLGLGGSGGLVRLEDVAEVVDTWEEATVLSRFDGQPSVNLSISKKAGGNSIQLIDQIQALVDGYNERLDDRVSLSVSGDSSIQIENMLSDLETNALFGMVLVVLVLWAFLGLRNALIVALGIPLAFLSTFIFMHATGETLNGNSLFGLVLVLGIIVDDAIVLTENAVRHRGMGKSRYDAIVDGVGEVALPVAAAILTTVAAFLPLMLMPGILGKFMRIIPVVVSMALVASLVEALVSMPCHIYEWGEQDEEALEKRSSWFEAFVRPYVAALTPLVSARIPRLSRLEGTQRTGARIFGWVMGGLPTLLAPTLLGAAAGWASAGASGPPGSPGTEATLNAAVLGACGGLASALLLLAILSAVLRRDFLGNHGVQLANLAGLLATGLLFFAGAPALMFAIFGPAGAVVGGLVPIVVVGVLGAMLLARGALGALLRDGWLRMRNLRWTIFAAVYLGMIPLAVAIASSVDLDLFSGDEIPQFFVRVRLPEGTALAETDRVIREMERLSRDTIPADELQSITANSGLLMTDAEWFIKRNVGQLIIDLTQPQERERTVQDIVATLRPVLARVPGPDSVEIVATNSGPPAGADVELKIQGDDLERLVQVVKVAEEEMRLVPGVEDIRDDWVLGKTELRVTVDAQQAALHGVAERDVGLALRAAFDGLEATRFRDGDEDVPVLVRYADASRHDLSWIERTRVPSQLGGMVPLADVARVQTTQAVDAIRRYKGSRTVTITASVDAAQTTSVAATQAVRKRLADFAERFPGYRVDYSGEFEEFQKSLEALLSLGVLGMLLVYLILGAQFRSFLQPVIIIGFTFPGALLGSAIALLVTGTPLSMLTLYGVVALLGIVVNDSLVFISFINECRQRGLEVADAVLEAGRVRLRPIVLTTITTVFGLTPMALGLGGKSQAWGPLATTIVFGLIVATLTTLFVIPPVYRCFADLAEVWATAWRRLGMTNSTHEELAPAVP
jgi:multidrug efflux pump subunit AcrB